MNSFIALFFSMFVYANETVSSDCIKWFEQSKVKKEAKDCLLKCATQKVDMGTFHCPDQCESLCNENIGSSVPGKLLYYPGLTPEEKKLVEKYPKDAVTVFIQKTRAEFSASRNFPEQDLNDESDAFRHFIWAGLLTKELGKVKAKEFLDAHEANRLQGVSEKDMDLFNNQKGQQSAETLISENKWSLKNIEAEGLKALREHQLRVLKLGLKIPEIPK